MSEIKKKFTQYSSVATASTDIVWTEARQLSVPHPVWDGSEVVYLDPMSREKVRPELDTDAMFSDTDFLDVPAAAAVPKAEKA